MANVDCSVDDPSKSKKYGCEHYERKCAFVSPCCGKTYSCRICHNEEESHEIDRKSVASIKCLLCNLQQKVQEACEGCKVKFGNYFCEICRLYDDVDKKQFHCEPCGICRVGGRGNYFHCKKCDMCLPKSNEEHHKCVEKASRTNCPICMEDLHTSRITSHVPHCGHLLHTTCYNDMLKSGNYTCPLCNESMVDMEKAWEFMDQEVASTPMPEEYKDTKLHILCRDCHKESDVLFHVVGLKCSHCGSYNTCGADGEDEGGSGENRDGANREDANGTDQARETEAAESAKN